MFKNSITKNQIKKIVKKVFNSVKKQKDSIALIHFGSSLNPKQMVIESDVDFLAVMQRKPKKKSEFWTENLRYKLIETTVHSYSKKEFLKGVKEGFPLFLMALKFGRFLYGKYFLETLKKRIKPTEKTVQTWYENGKSVYDMAMMEYFSKSCVGCYLKYCHHAARSLLRSYILKHNGLLCSTDKIILENIPKKLIPFYQKIIEYRKRSDISFELKGIGITPKKVLSDKAGKLFLCLEKIFAYIVRNFEEKEIFTLREIYKEFNDKIFCVHVNDKYFIHLLTNRKNNKFVTRELYKN